MNEWEKLRAWKWKLWKQKEESDFDKREEGMREVIPELPWNWAGTVIE